MTLLDHVYMLAWGMLGGSIVCCVQVLADLWRDRRDKP